MQTTAFRLFNQAVNRDWDAHFDLDAKTFTDNMWCEGALLLQYEENF